MADIKKIGVLTGGGDCSGLNAVVRAVVLTAINKYGCEVVGFKKGYAGLYANDFMALTVENTKDILDWGGTILKNSNKDNLFNYAYRDENGKIQHKDVSDVAVQNLKDNNIDALVVIGGDGSFTGAKLLSKLGVKTIGLPGTIDNDLSYTDYTIGFDTALNTVVDAIDKIRDTSTSHERVSIVEVMGRNCGDIALHTGIACGAEYIIAPEKGYDKDELCKVILEGKKAGKMHNLVLLAEGVGGAEELAKYIEAETKIETRATVLGHIQRGGAPSAFDRVLASRMGSRAIELLMEGKTSRVVGIKENEIFDQDIDEALALERKFDEKLYEISEEISK
jgi:6-phosphofructokinase 1